MVRGVYTGEGPTSLVPFIGGTGLDVFTYGEVGGLSL